MDPAAKKKSKIYGITSNGGPQDIYYGISWDNIADKLTHLNYRTKAIIRASVYIWITKGRYRKKGIMSPVYTLEFYKQKGKYIPEEHYNYLRNAISRANEYADYEGIWPEPENAQCVITIMPFRLLK